jgi:hypothetical protein
MRLTEALARLQLMRDWPVGELIELRHLLHEERWAPLLLRYCLDMTELDVADDDTPISEIRAAIADGRSPWPLLERIAELHRLEVLAECKYIGPRSDHPPEGPVDFGPAEDRDAAWSAPLPHGASRSRPRSRGGGSRMLQHPMDTLPYIEDMSRLDLASQYVADMERRQAEREAAQDPAARARAAQLRLARYLDDWERLVEARFAHVPAFIMGRVELGNATRVDDRPLRPRELDEARALAEQVAASYGPAAKAAALAIRPEQLVDHADWWWLSSVDKAVPNCYADAVRPLTSAILEMVIKELGLQARVIGGTAASLLGRDEALCILSEPRWEKGPTAPTGERRALVQAGQALRPKDWDRASSGPTASNKPRDGWLAELRRRLKGNN